MELLSPLVSPVARERWYVAVTLPNREALAVEHLARQSFNAFCPMEWVVRRHSRKEVRCKVPVFRGYVFISMDPAAVRWRSINGTLGVKSLITADSVPQPVPSGVVETLLDSVDEAGVLRFVDPLQPGMTVRLKSGPLAEQLGVIERLDGKSRVQLLLSVMGGAVRTTTGRDQVAMVA
ncbi:transcription termination/antitermination protein NusG [Oryzibacter oryziterrae]|uniref:transcription termination/antitermination protein NusG n=1 Tax=Oryzibacter oryziterrae TaxID=2766474 RepID=UPI001F40873E|nr:transcription termination/antitermination NusG family protein [Oryzibacter oryziterrae]